MLERVGHKIASCSFVDKIVHRSRRSQKSHRVEQDRWPAIDHVMCFDQRAIGCLHAADLGGDQLDHTLLFDYSIRQAFQKFCIDTIGDKDAELASFEPVRSASDDA